MRELLAKLEAAAEGSRELDCLIAVNPNTPMIGVVKGARVDMLLDDSVFGISGVEYLTEELSSYLPKTNADFLGVPHYTTVFEDALLLVPIAKWSQDKYPGSMAWQITYNRDSRSYSVSVREFITSFDRDFFATHADKYLAFCIAALKARFA